MFVLSADGADRVFGLSNVALIIGSALALVGGIGVYWAGKWKDHYSDERVTAAQAEAMTARRDLELAQERIKTLDLQIGDEKVRISAAEAQRVTAEVELEHLKAQVSWRHLAPATATMLQKRISASQPGKIAIVYPSGDYEALAYAMEFATIFSQQHWVVGHTPFNLQMHTVVGLGLSGAQNAQTALVRSAFTEAGIDFSDKGSGEIFESLFHSDVTLLIVGIKPSQLSNISLTGGPNEWSRLLRVSECKDNIFDCIRPEAKDLGH